MDTKETSESADRDAETIRQLREALTAILPWAREYDVFHNDDEDLRAAWDKVKTALTP